MHARRTAPPVVLAALALLVSSLAYAQRHRAPTPPPAPPITMESSVIEWTVFVSSFHDTAARRSAVPAEITEVVLAPDAGWACSIGAPTRARIDDSNWSKVRALTCTRGDAVVSTNGFCQIAGTSWGARAGVLSLGTGTSSDRALVTLDCAIR